VAGRYNLVTDWGYRYDEIDQYLYGPSTNLSGNCSVGYSGSCGSGELTVAPFMKWLHDGGPYAGSGAVEFTQIKGPLLAQGAGTPYEVFTTDYCLYGSPNCGLTMYWDDATFRLWSGGVIKATVRAGDANWKAGCIQSGGAKDCAAWYIGDLSSAGVFASQNVFGVLTTTGTDPADGVLPYAWRPSERTNTGKRGQGLPSTTPGKRANPTPRTRTVE
jgi:hypothetical protein